MHTLILLGELDRTSAATLEMEIERLCDTPNTALTVDLSRLTRIDATGVAVIVFRFGLSARRGHEMKLIAGTPVIQQAFELAGVAGSLPFVPGDAVTVETPAQPTVDLTRTPSAADARPHSRPGRRQRRERDLTTVRRPRESRI